jgi:hypothetical protein
MIMIIIIKRTGLKPRMMTKIIRARRVITPKKFRPIQLILLPRSQAAPGTPLTRQNQPSPKPGRTDLPQPISPVKALL